MSSFPTAVQAREQAQNYSVISVEVQAIETAIIAAITANAFTATVTDNTAMTNSTPVDATSQAYFSVWKGTTTDVVKTEQMTEVMKHFTDKGYTIDRITASAVSSDTFYWSIAF